MFRHVIALFLLPCALLMPAQAAERVALVIGNSRYADKPLGNPRHDAEDMAALLRDKGFEVIEKQDLDIDGLESALSQFKQKLRGSRAGLFFYAGHAVQVDGRNYLIPLHAEMSEPEQLQRKALDLESGVLDVMQNAGSRVNIVILDACRDNPFTWSRSQATRGLARVEKPSFIVAYSTLPGQTAQDYSENNRNSVYTQYLLDIIRANPNGKIEEIFKQVRVKVSGETDDKQIPMEYSVLKEDFCFGQCGGAEQLALHLGGQGEPPRVQPSTASPGRTGSASGQEIIVAGRTYIAYADGTALDTETGLMWMRCSLGQTWNGNTCTGEAETFNNWEAKKQTANFAGYSDWRLPSIDELRTLVYCSNGKPEYFSLGKNGANGLGCDGNDSPTIVQSVFPNTPDFVWSSSAYAGNSSDAWGVGFDYGYDNGNDRNIGNHVRLVRGELRILLF